MLPVERHRLIAETLHNNGRITVREIIQFCRISQETARRDLAHLEKRGLLLRSHGGAVPLHTLVMGDKGVSTQVAELGSSFRQRSNENPDQKTKIAKRALEFITPGDCLLLDSSSTSWFLARQLPDIELVVLTNSLRVVQTLAPKAHIRTIALGGEYSNRYEDFIGILTAKSLKEFAINKLFFSCHGISVGGGVRESNEHHAYLKQQMLLASERKFLLADSSKFGIRSFAPICHYRDIDFLITDKLEDKEFRQELAWSNVNVIEVTPPTINKPLRKRHN